MWVYRVLRSFLRLATQVFFRRIEVSGLENVPREGEAGVVFCGNHPNSLLDPVLVTAWSGRIVHFAAKDVLFSSRVLRVFLRAAGAVPLRRRRDHPDGPLDNDEAFAALHAVLAEGRAAGIFPEGLSHHASQLAPLKTGAARIALGAKAAHPERAIVLVPTGLCYFRRNRFRSSVLLQFGEPVTVDAEWVERYARDPKEASRELTRGIEVGLRALTINAEDWDTIRVLDAVRRLYQPPRLQLVERAELARRFNQHYPAVRDRPDVQALFESVRQYQERIRVLGLSDAALRREASAATALRQCVRHALWLAAWLPLAAVGAVVHVPLGALLWMTGGRFAPRKDVIATTKFVVGVCAVAAAYVALAATAGVLWGAATGLAVLAALPLSGVAFVRVLARIDALRHVGLTFARLVSLRHEVEELRATRRALAERVVAAVNAHRPADLELLYPQEAS